MQENTFFLLKKRKKVFKKIRLKGSEISKKKENRDGGREENG